MPPLRYAALGLLLATITINLGQVSLSLDLLGWLLIALGMNQLTGSGGTWFLWTRNAALALVGLNLLLWLVPVAGTGLAVLVSTLSRLAVMAVIFCLCTGTLTRLGKQDTGHAVVLQVVRIALPLVSLAGAVFAVIPAPEAFPVGWLYPAQLVATLALAVSLWLLGSRYVFTR